MIGTPDARDELGKRAGERVARAGEIQKNVLAPALRKLSQPPVPHRLDDRIDEMFFDHLFGTLDMSDEEARKDFDRQLAEMARDELECAIERASLPDARRLKSISDSERVFFGALKKHFPDARSADTHGERG
jgi:hypothetical protein